MATVVTRARTVGIIARDILTSGATVEVAAVFDRSTYLQLAGGFVCVGTPEIGDGPINATITVPTTATFAALGFHVGIEGRVEAERIVFDDGPAIEFANAAIWLPPEPATWTVETLNRGLTTLKALSTKSRPADGLSCLVFGGVGTEGETPTARAATEMLAELRASLPAAMRSESATLVARPATLLLGLGPGLTPSGDDLLGGIMLALSALQHITLRDALWDVLAPELGDLTNEISAMHLALAADGLGSDAMLRAISAIISGDDATNANAVTEAGNLGHTSGWDALAGIAIVCEAWLAAKTTSIA
jgi:Protein of unknown function (DUF2877)